MNKKQLYHIADIIFEQEKIIRKDSATKEEKDAASQIISKYANLIMSIGPQGMSLLMELDDILDKKLKSI